MTKDPFRSLALLMLREFGFPSPSLFKVKLAITVISLARAAGLDADGLGPATPTFWVDVRTGPTPRHPLRFASGAPSKAMSGLHGSIGLPSAFATAFGSARATPVPPCLPACAARPADPGTGLRRPSLPGSVVTGSAERSSTVLRPFPRLRLYGCRTAGSEELSLTAGSFPGASGLSRRQPSFLLSSPASVAGLQWSGPACPHGSR
jgi:hypothetical protein